VEHSLYARVFHSRLWSNYNFFHCASERNICNKATITVPTSSTLLACRYTTLWNIRQFLTQAQQLSLVSASLCTKTILCFLANIYKHSCAYIAPIYMQTIKNTYISVVEEVMLRKTTKKRDNVQQTETNVTSYTLDRTNKHPWCCTHNCHRLGSNSTVPLPVQQAVQLHSKSRLSQPFWQKYIFTTNGQTDRRTARNSACSNSRFAS